MLLNLPSLIWLATTIPSAVFARLDSPLPGTLAPEGCKKLSIDADWPTKDILDAELPGWEPRMAGQTAQHPDWTYDVKTVASVQRAVQFAAKHNVRISILNSGHDFLGRNDAPSGLLLYVAGLKGVRVLESFAPTAQGAEPVTYKTNTNVIKAKAGQQAAVTFGAGLSYGALNKQLAKSGLWVVGAAHGEVTVAGGWAQSGGHGPMSMEYGLGADNVLEYKVVTPDGKLTIANAVSNPDLFWALRGGGPSTWGVVVEATVKAYPIPKTTSYIFYVNTTEYDDRKSVFPPAAYLHSQLPRLATEGGIQGYIYIHPNAIRATLQAPNSFANAKKMRDLLDPVVTKISQFPGMNKNTFFKISPIDPILPGAAQPGPNATNITKGLPGATETNNQKPGTAPGPARLTARHGPGEMMLLPNGILDQDSRLLGEKALTSDKLAEALEKIMPFDLEDGVLRQHLVSGPKLWQQGNDTSVHPAWRSAFVHSVATGAGTPNAQALRDLAPDSGAYVNEAWIGNPNWKETFWGPHYDKLSEIKSKWDPNMVFYVTPGINADHMALREDGRLCKASGPIQRVALDASPIGDNKNKYIHKKMPVTFPIVYQGKGKPSATNWGNLVKEWA